MADCYLFITSLMPTFTKGYRFVNVPYPLSLASIPNPWEYLGQNIIVWF
jgi:hypothetical protein